MGVIPPEILAYNAAMPQGWQAAGDWLAGVIDAALPEAEAKVWHRTAVWFLAGNPVVGYSARKAGVQLLFWSGQSFDEPGLKPEGSFKAAEAWLTEPGGLAEAELSRWLAKARVIQWDYASIVKRKGRLEKLGDW